MRKEAALPIRLDAETKVALNKIAETTGLSVSSLVRMLVKSFVEEYDRSGGTVRIPPQWQRKPEPLAYRPARKTKTSLPKAAEARAVY